MRLSYDTDTVAGGFGLPLSFPASHNEWKASPLSAVRCKTFSEMVAGH